MSLPRRVSPDGSPMTPRRLALANAIAGLRGEAGLTTPSAGTTPHSAATPRAPDEVQTLDEDLPERPWLPPPTLPSEEAARFPIITRGTYDIAGKFAQGGIGRILRAHDPVLGRTVALKELLVAGHRTDEERFVREVLLTARLQHPGIVPVYAAGRWPSGEPFYAMKLVSGRSFDQVIAEATTLPARLALLPHVLAIAETLAYAHSQEIIHRDLKPNNVLVGEFGETVVIDWGLAKQLGEPEPDAPAAAPEPERSITRTLDTTQQLTHVGAIVGTPGYMSPEQADSAPVDARTDVYALGVILYQTLTGRLPYDAENAVELLFKTVYDPPIPLQRREPQVPEELAAIVDKAMARDTAARYPTAKAFADDLRRFQTGQIVGAHRYTAWELLVRVLRRYRTTIAVAAVALVIVIITVTYSFRTVAAERDLAMEAEVKALAARNDALTARNDALAARNDAIQRADVLALEQARLRVENDPGLALDLLHKTSPGADWRRIRQIAAAVQEHGIPTVLRGHQAAVSRAVFSPDSQRMATTSDDCTLRVWNLADRTSRVYFGHTDEVWRAAWSSDQRRIASTSRDKTVRVWDVDSGAAQVLVGHEAGIRNVAFGPEGRTMYSGDDARVLRRWQLDTGTSEVLDRCIGSAFPWDERQVACIAEDSQEVHVHDPRTGELERLRVDGVHLGVNGSISPDGRWVAAGTTDTRVVLWDRHTGKSQILGLNPPSDAVGAPREIRFSAASDRLLVPMPTHVLATYHLFEKTAEQLRPHTGYTRRATFSPDGALIASVGGDIGVKVWDGASASERSLVGAQALMIDVQFSRDGEYLATVGNDPRVFVWPEKVFKKQSWRLPGAGAVAVHDAPAVEAAALVRDGALTVLDTATLRPRLQISSPRPLTAVALTPTATRVIGADAEGTVNVWDARTGDLLHTRSLGAAAGACEATPAPNGAHAVLYCADHQLRWLDLGTGELTVIRHDYVGRVVFEPISGALVIGGDLGELERWEPARREWRRLHNYFGIVQVLGVIPGQRQVVVGCDRLVDVWDLDTGTKTGLPGHILQVDAIAVSGDGARVATSGRDNLVRVYDRATSRLLRTITPNTLLGSVIRLSHDGSMLASTTHDGDISLWDLGGDPAVTGEPRLLAGHNGRPKVLRFAPAGDSLLSIDSDGRATRWSDDLPRDADGVRAWVAAHHDPDTVAPATRTGCITAPPGL